MTIANSGATMFRWLLALLLAWCLTPLARAADAWGPTGALQGVRIQSLAVDPAAPDTLYAGSVGGGLFKSSNGGAAWAPVNSGLGNWNVWVLAADPAAAGTLYAGTANGVFKSTNGGGAWSAASSGLARTDIRALAVDPSAPGTVYAGTMDGGAFKSTDGGATWAAASNGITNNWVRTLVFDPAAPGTVYAGTGGGGVFKTTDGGGTWAPMNGGLANRSVWMLALDPAAPGTLYAATLNGVFKRSAGDASWIALSSGLGNMDVRVVALDPATPGRLYAGTNTGGVYRSIVSSPTVALPDSGQPVTLALPGGGSITATAQQPGTQVQLVETVSGPMVAVVTAGSALLQHSTAGQPLAGLPRSGGMAVLTPSCVAARVIITVTGDTRTAFSDGCAVALSGAGEQVPAMESPGNIPAQDVRVHAPGPLNQRSLLVAVDVAALSDFVAPAGRRVLARDSGFNVYVLAFLSGELVGSPVPLVAQKLPMGGWGPLTAPLAALMSNVAPQSADARVLIEVVRDNDLAALVGTEIYIGYGVSDEEMLQAGRYRAVYRIK